jgi:hypothetical protein
VGDIDLYRAAFGQRLDRVVDENTFFKVGAREFSHRHLENDVVLADRIDPRCDRAASGDLVGRTFNLRIDRKGDPEGIVGIVVFLPALRGGGSTGDERGQDERDRAHLGFPPGLHGQDDVQMHQRLWDSIFCIGIGDVTSVLVHAEGGASAAAAQ